MSVDTFGHMLSFLDIRSIESLQQTNKEHKKVVDTFSHIYYESALREQYGESIIVLLKNTDEDYRKNIKIQYVKIEIEVFSFYALNFEGISNGL